MVTWNSAGPNLSCTQEDKPTKDTVTPPTSLETCHLVGKFEDRDLLIGIPVHGYGQ
jgi:hypothetical protein